MALYNLSQKRSGVRVIRKTLVERLKVTRTIFNGAFLYWLSVGMVDGSRFEIWLTDQGLGAIEQYRLPRKP